MINILSIIPDIKITARRWKWFIRYYRRGGVRSRGFREVRLAARVLYLCFLGEGEDGVFKISSRLLKRRLDWKSDVRIRGFMRSIPEVACLGGRVPAGWQVTGLVALWGRSYPRSPHFEKSMVYHEAIAHPSFSLILNDTYSIAQSFQTTSRASISGDPWWNTLLPPDVGNLDCSIDRRYLKTISNFKADR